jgi:hypothetical protein
MERRRAADAASFTLIRLVNLPIPLVQRTSRLDVELPRHSRIQPVPGHTFEELPLAAQNVALDR